MKKMLNFLGLSSEEELFSDIPTAVKLSGELALPRPLSEIELSQEIRRLSEKNQETTKLTSFLGGGIYHHFIPAVVPAILNRSEFYTAYTPYQAEISQGLLEAVYLYQTLITKLTGMDVTNASLYDGATAICEAANLAINHTKKRKINISKTVHPHYRQVLKTYAKAANWEIVELDFDQQTGQTLLPSKIEGAILILSQPNFFGVIEEVKSWEKVAHENMVLLSVSSDPISLALLKPPGEYGADIVTAEGQSLGIPQSLGGPGLGIFAVKDQLKRLMPGRIVGKTVDAEGKEAFCLTLQTREQHIRRERATSNICSNQALCALAATVYLSVMGKSGFKNIAQMCYQKTEKLKEALNKLKGIEIPFCSPTFKEFVIKVKDSKKLNQALLKAGIMGGLDLGAFYPELSNHLLFCVTEMVPDQEIDRLVNLIKDFTT